VQKTVNGGATWQRVTLPASLPIAAAAAPAPATCWLVGAGGAVFLTVDGETWTRVPFPETVDLTAVVADARGATVATADGRRFETRDAGASWREQH
jgi:photosystem II stability/assembly factor-like uncharacterized protein